MKLDMTFKTVEKKNNLKRSRYTYVFADLSALARLQKSPNAQMPMNESGSCGINTQ